MLDDVQDIGKEGVEQDKLYAENTFSFVSSSLPGFFLFIWGGGNELRQLFIPVSLHFPFGSS